MYENRKFLYLKKKSNVHVRTYKVPIEQLRPSVFCMSHDHIWRFGESRFATPPPGWPLGWPSGGGRANTNTQCYYAPFLSSCRNPSFISIVPSPPLYLTYLSTPITPCFLLPRPTIFWSPSPFPFSAYCNHPSSSATALPPPISQSIPLSHFYLSLIFFVSLSLSLSLSSILIHG